MQPWLPESGHVQAVVSTLDPGLKTGFTVLITESGVLEFWIGTEYKVEVITTDFRPKNKR
jgi:hypothetical protein